MKGECLHKNNHKVSWLSSNGHSYKTITQNRVNSEYAVRHIVEFSYWNKEMPGCTFPSGNSFVVGMRNINVANMSLFFPSFFF
jgi:hypothetical protein